MDRGADKEKGIHDSRRKRKGFRKKRAGNDITKPSHRGYKNGLALLRS